MIVTRHNQGGSSACYRARCHLALSMRATTGTTLPVSLRCYTILLPIPDKYYPKISYFIYFYILLYILIYFITFYSDAHSPIVNLCQCFTPGWALCPGTASCAFSRQLSQVPVTHHLSLHTSSSPWHVGAPTFDAESNQRRLRSCGTGSFDLPNLTPDRLALPGAARFRRPQAGHPNQPFNFQPSTALGAIGRPRSGQCIISWLALILERNPKRIRVICAFGQRESTSSRRFARHSFSCFNYRRRPTAPGSDSPSTRRTQTRTACSYCMAAPIAAAISGCPLRQETSTGTAGLTSPSARCMPAAPTAERITDRSIST